MCATALTVVPTVKRLPCPLQGLESIVSILGFEIGLGIVGALALQRLRTTRKVVRPPVLKMAGNEATMARNPAGFDNRLGPAVDRVSQPSEADGIDLAHLESSADSANWRIRL